MGGRMDKIYESKLYADLLKVREMLMISKSSKKKRTELIVLEYEEKRLLMELSREKGLLEFSVN